MKIPNPKTTPIEESSESIYETDSNSDGDYMMEDENEPALEISEADQLRLEIEQLREQLESLQKKYDEIEREKLYLQSKIYNYDNVSKNEKLFRKATGVHVEKFNALLKFIDSGKESCNIKMYDTSKRLSEETYTITEEEYINKPGRTPRLDHREQFFL